MPTAPPRTERREVVEELHGERLVDPYRWLEGDTSDPARMGRMTREVAAWTEAQNAHTRAILDGEAPGFEGLAPQRERLERELRGLLELGEIGLPTMAGRRVFYSQRTGTQAQPIVYVREGADGAPRALIDPLELDPEGLVSVSWFAPSRDGARLAFGTDRAGDENSVLHVLDVEGGAWLADEIPGKVFLSGWLPDGARFFYQRLEDLDDPYSAEIRLHELGRPWREDPVLLRQREVAKLYAGLGLSAERLAELATTWGPSFEPGRDGRWGVVSYWTGTSSNDLWILDLAAWLRTGELALTPLLVGADGRNEAVVAGGAIYLLTCVDAPNGRVVRIDPNEPARARWRDVVPHRDDAILRGFALAEGRIAASYLEDASTRVRLFTRSGEPAGALALPGLGTAALSAEPDRSDAFLSYESFDAPQTIYRVDLARPEDEPRVWARIEVPFELASLTVERARCTSRDGTSVGLFLVHRRGLERDGDNPTLLHGYGGFDVPMVPGFSATLLPFLERGGVYALANLRGGGEGGLEWHRAGTLARKQNVFDDFIAAAEWLIERGYTRPERLAVAGGSNGGLLTGAMITQRPELVAAAIVGVPLLDMLRYEKFLMARYWVPEYGSAEDAEPFKYLRAYSPYHNVRHGTKYPAVLLTAGENDTRVHPMHARKMAAALQAATASDPAVDPILLWVDRDAGHGAGKPLHLRLRDVVDQRLFVMWQLGMLERG